MQCLKCPRPSYHSGVSFPGCEKLRRGARRRHVKTVGARAGSAASTSVKTAQQEIIIIKKTRRDCLTWCFVSYGRFVNLHFATSPLLSLALYSHRGIVPHFAISCFHFFFSFPVCSSIVSKAAGASARHNLRGVTSRPVSKRRLRDSPSAKISTGRQIQALPYSHKAF